MVAGMIPGGAVTPPFSALSSAPALHLSPGAVRSGETDNFWLAGEQAFPARAQGCVRSSTTPTRAAAAGYMRQSQRLAGASNSASAPRSWRASEPISRLAHQSTDRSPTRYTSRQSASAAFMPAPGRGCCISAPAPIAGGTFTERREAKSTSPERAAGLETRFRKIVEDQLLTLTHTLDKNLQQRFAELEGRLDHGSLQRRLVELESRLGQEIQHNVAQGKVMEQVDWKAEQAAGTLEQVGLKVDQACAMAEERARQALEAASLRHRNEFMTVSERRLQEHSDLLALHNDKLESKLAKIEERQTVQQFSPVRASEACLKEIRQELASLRGDLNSQISSGKTAQALSRLDEALQEVSKLRSDFEGYVASWAEQQEPLPEPLRQAAQQFTTSHRCQGYAEAVSEEGAVLTQELRKATAPCHQSHETLLQSPSEVEEAKLSVNSELQARSKGQERVDHAKLVARETADMLRSALADYRATSKEMASMAVELKSAEDQAAQVLQANQRDDSLEVVPVAQPRPEQPSSDVGRSGSPARKTIRLPPSEITSEGIAAVGLDPGSPLFDREKQRLRVELVRAAMSTPDLVVETKVPDLPPQGAFSAPTLASTERQGQLVEIVRQAILTDVSGTLEAEKAALARRRRSRSAPATGQGRAAAADLVQAGSLAAGGSTPAELVDIVKAALAGS